MSVISGVKTDAITIGKSATDSQNFQLSANNDGTAKLARGSDGSLGDILTVASDGKVTLVNGSTLQSATAQASTSGTSIDFTGIPSWAKRITVMFSGVSTNGSSVISLQLGDNGGVENTGYLGTAVSLVNGSTVVCARSTSMFVTGAAGYAAAFFDGVAYLSLLKSATNTWVLSGNLGRSDVDAAVTFTGSKSLSATLDSIRITTVNGTDTFDAGSINIMWE